MTTSVSATNAPEDSSLESDNIAKTDNESAPGLLANVPHPRKHYWAALWLLVSLLSVLWLAPMASSPAAVVDVRDSLDEQQGQVMTLAAGATALSAGLSLVPGDAMMPIADQLADLTGWFMVIVGAIVLQKILFTSAGFIAFTFVIPLACLLAIGFVYLRQPSFRAIAWRLATFGVVLFAAVPASIAVSEGLTSSYSGLAEAAAATEDSMARAQGFEGSVSGEVTEGTGEPEGVLDRLGGWVSGAFDNVGDWFASVGTTMTEFRQDSVDALNSYIEQIALLTITTCVMPLLVLMFFGWIVRQLFAIEINVGGLGRSAQRAVSSGVKRGGRRVRGWRGKRQ